MGLVVSGLAVISIVCGLRQEKQLGLLVCHVFAALELVPLRNKASINKPRDRLGQVGSRKDEGGDREPETVVDAFVDVHPNPCRS